MEKPGSKPTRIDELDGLRGFLALWVAVSHIVCLSGNEGISIPFHLHNAWGDFVFAEPAVEAFIILSGFAISFLLHARPQTYAEFMIGRFFRIVPTYFVCLALGTWVALEFTPWLLDHAAWRAADYFTGDVRLISNSEQQHPGAHLFWHALLLHGLVPRQVLFASGTALLPPGWSISLEWQYYLLAPLIARLVRSNVAVLFLVMTSLVTGKMGNLWHNPAFLPPQLDLFLIGIGSYHLYSWSRTTGQAPTSRWTRFVLAAFAFAVLTDWHSVALQIWVIVFGASFVSGNDPFARWIAKPRVLLLRSWPQLLGRWSYPLYLIHWPLIILMLCFLVNFFPGITSRQALLAMLLAGLPLLVAAAALLHYLVERPTMRWGRKFTHRTAVPHTHPAPMKDF
jgi:peptidoglycan/LPS O-acetylase OafA/YrhL